MPLLVNQLPQGPYYGVLAQFGTAAELYHACERVRWPRIGATPRKSAARMKARTAIRKWGPYSGSFHHLRQATSVPTATTGYSNDFVRNTDDGSAVETSVDL